LYRFKIRNFGAMKQYSSLPINMYQSMKRLYREKKNPPFWSDEAIQFPSHKHVSIDEAIVSLQIRQFGATERYNS
jgi:hypothetical protein